jgi:hypothetical protein
MTMAETATDKLLQRDNDMHAARQTAGAICDLLRGFIPERAREEAWSHVLETAYKEGWELTDKARRKEYEASKRKEVQAALSAAPRHWREG